MPASWRSELWRRCLLRPAGSSSFEVDFTLDAATDFLMSGTASYQGTSGKYDIHLEGPTTLGLADGICNFGAGQFNNCFYSNDPSGVNPTSHTTELAAGAYKLFVSSTHLVPDLTRNESVDVNFKMTFTPVPLPAAAWLLASGLLGMLGFNRRRAWVAG